ncbi:lysophospholipase L1-like esterase [Prosthecobacter fusiformis]|uniref:Lysophospholipase L1-like esterase n=2 Tax=Prosthecobacter fusiformis TaxID=48464 RepID=A0A4R7SQA0_9BACT|nr:lysophospholipase L1-like esterase [Prosthecobacter fusiformis]
MGMSSRISSRSSGNRIFLPLCKFSLLDIPRRIISNTLRMIRNPLFAAALACLLGSLSAPAQNVVAPVTSEEKTSFEFKDGDRVVLIGNTVIEREQRYATFEPRLALALGETKVTVRNLAWSGDTVYGHARSYFGPPEEGLERMTQHLQLLKPNVVLLCYGSEMAFEGLKDLPRFLTGYRNLLSLIRKQSPGVRIIVATPPPLETLPPPLPDQTDANKRLSSFRDALRKFAAAQNTYFVDWFELMGGIPKPGQTSKPLTENGVHYTREGYEKLSTVLIEGLGYTFPQVTKTELDPLQREVLKKDELFFNRWRPQNETYLFGFRKHEQGQNAKEIPMFDPLIDQADAKIQELKAAILASKKAL